MPLLSHHVHQKLQIMMSFDQNEVEQDKHPLINWKKIKKK